MSNIVISALLSSSSGSKSLSLLAQRRACEMVLWYAVLVCTHLRGNQLRRAATYAGQSCLTSSYSAGLHRCKGSYELCPACSCIACAFALSRFFDSPCLPPYRTRPSALLTCGRIWSRDLPPNAQISAPSRLSAPLVPACPPSGFFAPHARRRLGSGCSCSGRLALNGRPVLQGREWLRGRT